MQGPDTFSPPPGVIAALGVPIARLCERIGVKPSNAWLTSDFFALWAAADEALGDRSAGLRFGAEGIARGYGVASIVALHAPDFVRALGALSRYKRLTCPELVEVEIAAHEAIVRYRWLQATAAPPRLLVDTTMASLRELARRGAGGRVAPIRLELARRPGDHALLRRHFDCPIVFEAPYDAMVFDRAALDAPFGAADGGAFGHVFEGLEARISDGEGFSAIVGELRVAIARQLGEGHRPSLADVARRLRLSRRTLQRRLDDDETTFQQQLAEVRRLTACRLLANTELDPVAVWMLLGFEEPNSFTRAFRGWERTTPRAGASFSTAIAHDAPRNISMPPSRVLVTGGSGFIAGHCILDLLDRGHRVRTTVRSLTKEGGVRGVLADEGMGHGGRLNVVAADLKSDEGWAEALADINYVLHVASPVQPGPVANDDDLIVPAREGTLRVLKAARDAGVKRVVLTSAFHAVSWGHPHDGRIFTEADWTLLERPGVDAYGKSKTLAERAAWAFMAAEGGETALTTMLPVAVMGPVMGHHVSGSNHLIQRMLNGGMPALPNLFIPVVDVRDVAAAHVSAMTHPDAAGERFLLSNAPRCTCGPSQTSYSRRWAMRPNACRHGRFRTSCFASPRSSTRRFARSSLISAMPR